MMHINETFNYEDLGFSIVLVVVAFFICNLLRQFVGSLELIGDDLKKILYEVITSAETTVFTFEINFIIWENYSISIYIMSLYLFALYSASIPLQYQADGNPVVTFRLFLLNVISLPIAIVNILGQVVGSILIYPLVVRPVWGNAWLFITWKNENLHTTKILSPIWETSIIESDVQMSAISEAGITLCMYFTPVLFSKLDLNQDIVKYIVITINTLIYASGAPYSGAYYNPAVATSGELLMTTSRNYVSKIWVYWISPLFGIVVALFIQPYLISTDNLN